MFSVNIITFCNVIRLNILYNMNKSDELDREEEPQLLNKQINQAIG